MEYLYCSRVSYKSETIRYHHWSPKNRVDVRFPSAWNSVEEKPWWNESSVALLVRDPRDVVVSYFFHYTKRMQHKRKFSISEFIRDPNWGVDRVILFYNAWNEIWKIVPHRLLIKYEDFQKDCYTEFKRLLDFFSIETNDSAIEDAINHGSFDNMRTKEQSISRQKPKVGLLGTNTPDDPESYKVRRGKVGGYVDYLTIEDIKYLDGRIEKELQGYDFYKNDIQEISQ